MLTLRDDDDCGDDEEEEEEDGPEPPTPVTTMVSFFVFPYCLFCLFGRSLFVVVVVVPCTKYGYDVLLFACAVHVVV